MLAYTLRRLWQFVPTLAGTMWPNGVDLTHVDLAEAAAGEFDCIVVVTDHSSFDYDHVQRAAKVVVDTRNAIKTPAPHVIRLGAARSTPAPELASTQC